MSKSKGSKKNQITGSLTIRGQLEELVKPLEIKEGAIKDDYCNYSYELLRGVGEGDTISRKGAAIIHDDMKDAFEALNVHLAVVDDAFKYSKIDIENIDEVNGHELTGLFSVSEFKTKGKKEEKKFKKQQAAFV